MYGKSENVMNERTTKAFVDWCRVSDNKDQQNAETMGNESEQKLT